MKWNKVGGPLYPNDPCAPDLDFGVTRESDLFSPLIGSVPQQLVASIQWFPTVVDLYVGSHLEGRELEDISLGDGLLNALNYFLPIGGLGGAEKRSEHRTHNNQENEAIHY
jgi:hypothetical protein